MDIKTILESEAGIAPASSGKMYLLNNKRYCKENLEYYLARLKCPTGCAKCCGNAFLFPNEVNSLAISQHMSPRQFKDEFTYVFAGHRVLKSPCPFLKIDRCSIYPFRPQVCRQFPFNRPMLVNGVEMMTVFPCPAGERIIKEYCDPK